MRTTSSLDNQRVALTDRQVIKLEVARLGAAVDRLNKARAATETGDMSLPKQVNACLKSSGRGRQKRICSTIENSPLLIINTPLILNFISFVTHKS